MSDNELLLAISEMMDKKIAPIRKELQDTKDELKADNAGLRAELKADIAGLRTELKGDIAGLRAELDSVKLTLENDIRPRLQNIEDCYVSTYKRYQSGINQLEAMQQDIDVIKRVVLEHSEKLNKIA